MLNASALPVFLSSVLFDAAVVRRREKATLQSAIESGQVDFMRELINRGADIHFINKSGRSLLRYAVKKGNRDLVALLIENGVNVNVKRSSGANPIVQ